MPPGAMSLPAEGCFVGTITRLHPREGYGFIDCQEAFDQHGCDVFTYVSRRACRSSLYPIALHIPYLLALNFD